METPTLIRWAVRDAGCSRAELARRAGISQSVLSAYEHGRREPSVASLDAILAAADMELAPRRRLREVDEVRCEQELLDVCSLVDGLPFTPPSEPLTYPAFSRRRPRRRT